jgi:aspartate racemase
MRKLGIIGGFGPKTTTEFFLSILSAWKKEHKDTRPEILIWNAAINEHVERSFIQKNRNHAEFRNILITGAKTLESAGADFLVIPCNSLHIFIDDVRKKVDIPILSIVDLTLKFLIKEGVNKVAVLGTQVTTNSHLFEKPLSKKNIKTLFIKKEDQQTLNQIIFNLATDKTVRPETFKNIINNLEEENPERILLACTDLQLIKHRDKRFIDTLALLKEETIKEIGK